MMELIVVMAITLIVLAAVFSLMRGAITTANANFEMTTSPCSQRSAV